MIFDKEIKEWILDALKDCEQPINYSPCVNITENCDYNVWFTRLAEDDGRYSISVDVVEDNISVIYNRTAYIIETKQYNPEDILSNLDEFISYLQRTVEEFDKHKDDFLFNRDRIAKDIHDMFNELSIEEFDPTTEKEDEELGVRRSVYMGKNYFLHFRFCLNDNKDDFDIWFYEISYEKYGISSADDEYEVFPDVYESCIEIIKENTDKFIHEMIEEIAWYEECKKENEYGNYI